MNSVFPALVRHFFGRFFDNEFVSQNSDMQVTVTKMLALLASPGMLLPFFRYTTYLGLDAMPPAARLPVLWFDRCFFFSFSMLVMGAVTVLEWDALFPDRRDYATLIPLPIRARTIFLGKIAALALFLVAFTAAVNSVSTVIFPVIGARGPLSWILRTIAMHGVSVLAASAFVFLFLVALEGVLLNVLTVRWFRKASVYVQCGMVFMLLSLFFLFPNIAGSIEALKARDAWTLYVYPPTWFLGLNEVLLGSRDPVFRALAGWAMKALAGVTLMAGAGYTLAYRRHVRRTLESMEGVSDGARSGMQERVGRAADRLVRHPLHRATVAFIGKTMARSGKHRIFLAAYTGVGCAFVLQGLVGSGLKQAWLSIPLVLSFFVLSGMRYIFTLPAELNANWIFRVTETQERQSSLNGTGSAMLWFGVAPLFAALAPFYFVLWGPGVALAHLAFSLTISILLIEAMTFNFWKIPFTCSYPPGKANVTVMWIWYWLAFTTYAYSMASLEAWMVLRPWRLVVFYAAAGVLWAGFEWNRRRWDRVGFTLLFDDAPDPTVRTLGLSELGWLARVRTAGERAERVVRR